MLYLGSKKEIFNMDLEIIYERLSEQVEDCKGALATLELEELPVLRDLEWYKLRAHQGLNVMSAIGKIGVLNRFNALQHVIKNAESVLDEYSVPV